MDSNNGGPSSNSDRRKTAAEIAREKVLAVYSSTVKSLKKLSADPKTAKNDQYLTPPTPGAYYSDPNANSSTSSENAAEPDPSAYPTQYISNSGYSTSAANDYDQPSTSGDYSSTYNSYAANSNTASSSYNSTSYSDAYNSTGNPYTARTGNASYDYNDYYNNPGSSDQSATAYPESVYSDVPTHNSAGYDYTDETSSLKDAPINQTAVTDEWQQYHSAWQNYYQNYYSEYYAKAAQNYLASEKLKNERVATGTARKHRHVKRLIPIFILGFVILATLFLQYNRLIFAPIMAYVSPNPDSAPTNIEAVDPTVSGSVTADPRLIIPKLNIDVPVAFDIHYNDAFEAMNHGVAQFKIPGASALPGQIGNLVISGHSAGDIYSSNPYKFIFSGLERLQPGDLIYINYESKRYTYQMTGSEVVEPSNVAALVYETDKPILTLITCTPLGTSRYRLLVIAEQISPAYDTNTPPETPPIEGDTDSGISMPSNEPSFFESIWSGLFGS